MPTPTSEGQGDLCLTNVTKRFGDFTAVDDLSLTIPQGSFFALLGASGCGKTTTLRMVAGLERPTAGTISIGEEDITEAKPYARPVNTVFQNYALFPHMTVLDNVAFGLKRRKVADATKMAKEGLELVELGHLAGRKPAQLSGGQQQRVALARALVNHPAVLLLDEPLGALDLKLRRQMQLELKKIQEEVGLTFVHVTHDQEEAMTMADTIAVMNAGVIEQLGHPTELYERPASTFVANFLGQSNLLAGEISDRVGGDLVVQVGGHKLALPGDRSTRQDGKVWLGVRPEKLRIGLAGGADGAGRNHLDGVVLDASFTGVSTQYLVRLAWGQAITVVAQNDGSALLRDGDQVQVSWVPQHGFALDAAQDAFAGAQRVGDDDTPVPALGGAR
jgi:spermidine/putrescine transport system ATP-binding protein